MFISTIVAATVITTTPVEVIKPIFNEKIVQETKIPELFNPDCKEKTLFQDFSINTMINKRKE